MTTSDEIQNCRKLLKNIMDKMERGEVIYAHSMATTLFDRLWKVRDEVIKLETYRELKGKLIDESH